MRRAVAALLLSNVITLSASAQTPPSAFADSSRPEAVRQVYDESINPLEQIDKAVAKARSEGKFVVCQVGGNWCPWCLRFADFITKDTTISRVIDENFVYIHVNYDPRRTPAAPQNLNSGSGTTDSTDRTLLARKMLERLNNPARFGFPVFVVLDENGHVIHIQDSSFLEDGKGYSQEKVLRFFRNWTPNAVNQGK